MIKRNHIRHFLALTDAGSFVAAAARLHITQPTLSSGIAELERLVGTPLFLRDKRHIRLTEAGGAFLPIARDLERGFRIADSFGRDHRLEWPSLRLGVIRSVSATDLSWIVRIISQDHGVEIIEGTDYELRSALSAGRIHLALSLLREKETSLSCSMLWSEPYKMIVHANHRFATRDEVAPDELAGDIMIARRSCEILEETSRFFTSAGVRPRFALRSDNDERCLAMVAAGLGITTAPQSLAVAGTKAINVKGYNFSRSIGLIHDPAQRTGVEDVVSKLADCAHQRRSPDLT